MSRARLLIDLLSRPRAHRYGAHPSQCAELYLPRGEGPHPVVVAIHGGSWASRYGKFVMRGLAGPLCRSGWAVWNIEYRRLGGGGGWPATFEDVAAAVDHLALLDAPIDLARVTTLGHSAGGQLALWAAGRYKLRPSDPGGDPRVLLSAAVSMAGVLDMAGAYAAAGRDGAVGALMGGSPAAQPRRYDVGDPIRMVALDLPVLLIHGSEDSTVSVERSRAYAAAARSAGGLVELVEIPGAAGRHRNHLDPDGEPFALAGAWLGALRDHAPHAARALP